MIEINVDFGVSRIYVRINGYFGEITKSPNLILIGKPLRGQDAIAIEELQQALVSSVRNGDAVDSLSSVVRTLNGFFTIIFVSTKGVFISSDPLRSRPIFFASRATSIFISDDANWVADSACADQPDVIARDSLLRSLVSPGGRTLRVGVSQLEAAQTICFGSDGHRASSRYPFSIASFRSTPSPSREVAQEAVTEALLNSMRRLLAVYGGRQFVIPLSGGLDSRSILAALAILKYENVVAVTYGWPRSVEYSSAKHVADLFGVRWLGFPYGRSTWQRLNDAAVFDTYQRRSYSLTSCPALQGFPALLEIKERQLVEDSAVFIPGHSGDFLAGSHLLSEDFAPSDCSSEEVHETLTSFILRRHFGVNFHLALERSTIEFITELLTERAADIDLINSPAPRVMISQAWNQLERQSKFICNSNRYYDFFDYSWWMPLWDRELARAWESIPLAFRQDCSLWRSVVGGLVTEALGQTASDSISCGSLRRSLLQKPLGHIDPSLTLFSMPTRRWVSQLLRCQDQDYSALAWRAQLVVRRFSTTS